MIELLAISDLRDVVSATGGGSHKGLAELRHLLLLVSEEGPSLHWAVVPSSESTAWYARAERESRATNAFGERVSRSESAVPLAWRELVALADGIAEVSMATFVAVRDPETLHGVRALLRSPYNDLVDADPAFYVSVDLAFGVVWHERWLVWAKDATVRERIRSAFSSVETIPGGSFYKPTA